MNTRSAVFKMINSEVCEEKKIIKYPPPFSSQITPYIESDFDENVKQTIITRSLSPRISKVIILGDVTVGKTSLINRFCHKSFNNNYKATIGVDFEVEKFDILGLPFNLQIWDTAGQERFKCIAACYYRNANVIIVVFDLTNLGSLAHCQQWLLEASRNNSDKVLKFLVGTKRDLLTNKSYEIIERRAILIARLMNAEFWAVSAKTGDGISEFFTRVAALAFNSSILEELQSSTNRKIHIGSDLISCKKETQEPGEKKKEIAKCVNCSI